MHETLNTYKQPALNAWVTSHHATLQDNVKKLYQLTHEQLALNFLQKIDGMHYAHQRAQAIDKLLRALCAHYIGPHDYAIIALGGYGRAELTPASDIDIVFIYHDKDEAIITDRASEILNILWYCGCNIGHTLRPINSIKNALNDDVTIATSFLELRFISGQKKIYSLLSSIINNYCQKNIVTYIDKKQQERTLRLKKYGNTRNMLEPNIKHGKGALRDLHYIMWLLRAIGHINHAYHADELLTLIFDKANRARFNKIYHAYMSMRVMLHVLTKRHNDVITFDVQLDMADALHYKNRHHMRAVERLMRHYFFYAKQVETLVNYIDNYVYEHYTAIKHAKKHDDLVTVNGQQYAIYGPYITPYKAKISSQLHAIFSILQAAQAHNKAVHPSIHDIIQKFARNVRPIYYYNDAIIEQFLSILTAKSPIRPILHYMNDCGLLGRLIPDFGRVVAQMQYDMYHVYTTDEHTLRALGKLNDIERGLLTHEHPTASEEIHNIDSRRVLYMAVFLHDIAKGRAGDHSILGADIAHFLCPKLHFSSDETTLIAWLVEHHLLLSNTALRRDLDDNATIELFVQHVNNIEKLRLLFILTVVDIVAVSPNAWNNWKAALIRRLFYKSLVYIAPEEYNITMIEPDIMSRKQHLAQLLAQPEHIIFDIAPSSYFMTCDDTLFTIHSSMMAQHQEHEPLTINVHNNIAQDHTIISIYCPNYVGLMSKIAAALTITSITVLDARIHTFSNGMALDYFVVQNSQHHAINDSYIEQHIATLIKDILTDKKSITDHILAKVEHRPHRTDIFTVKPHVHISNKTSKNFTVIDIKARDRTGLLYAITKTLTQCNLRIGFARITTFGEEASDVFYVRDLFGMKIINEQKLHHITDNLLIILNKANTGDLFDDISYS